MIARYSALAALLAALSLAGPCDELNHYVRAAEPVADPISTPAELVDGAISNLQSLRSVIAEPTPAPPIVVAPPDYVAITDADGTRIDNPALEQFVTQLVVGEYTAVIVPKPGAKLTTLRITIAVQGPRPPPVVVVPDTPDVPTPDVPPAPPVTPDQPSKITAVTYVYEKDEGPVPAAVNLGLVKLNKLGILATEFEQNVFDGERIPKPYEVALSRAKSEGLPCLIVLADSTVVRAVPDRKDAPLTEAKILEAAK